MKIAAISRRRALVALAFFGAALFIAPIPADAQASPSNDTLKLLSTVKTTKGFDAGKVVTEAQLRQILACGVNAPSAQNKQPWYFSALIGPSILDELRAAAKAAMPKSGPGGPVQPSSPGNSAPPAGGPAPQGGSAPPAGGPGARDPLDGASAAILISGLKEWRWSTVDCALACEAMSIAAQSMGLGTHIVLGPVDALKGKDAAALLKKLGVPSAMEPQILLLVGYPAGGADTASRASARSSGNYSILK